TQQLDDPKPIEGELIHYSITVDNRAGPEEATGVRLSDVLSNNLTFQSALPSAGSFDSATRVWTVGSLAKGASATLVIAARVNPHTVTQQVSNVASVVAAAQPDPNPANNNSALSVKVRPGADLNVTIKVDN